MFELTLYCVDENWCAHVYCVHWSDTHTHTQDDDDEEKKNRIKIANVKYKMKYKKYGHCYTLRQLHAHIHTFQCVRKKKKQIFDSLPHFTKKEKKKLKTSHTLYCVDRPNSGCYCSAACYCSSIVHFLLKLYPYPILHSRRRHHRHSLTWWSL